MKTRRGFTIIEVMIVLAVAGLIMVIVFMAVPALQRNSRNNQYKHDAAKLIAAYKEVSANNNLKDLGETASWSSHTSATIREPAKTVLEQANTNKILYLGICSSKPTPNSNCGTTTLVIDTSVKWSSTVYVNIEGASIRTNTKCVAHDSGGAAVGSPQQIALYYAVETSSGQQIRCIDA